MNLPNNPVMLLSYINTKLRDEYENLTALCEDFSCEEGEIKEKLAQIGYIYSAEQNRFL